MTSFKVEWERSIYKGRNIEVFQRLLSNGDDLILRDVVDQPDAVGVVPHIVDPNGVDCVLLLNQFRPAIKTHIYEIPAGHVDQGEAVQVAARRELREETGIMGDYEYQWLMHYFANVGVSNHHLTLCAVKDIPWGVVEKVWNTRDAQGYEEEEMGYTIVSIFSAIDMIYSSKIIDSKTIIGIYALRDHLEGKHHVG